ncbi:preprotein translocase subunit SecG [Acidithiobacillus sp.]|nr:preprotein translocase subunit SecG [Acidithiobacillus sp.]
MYDFLLILQVIICVVLVGLVLIQKGQGADIGAVFGGGGSQTVFGARGAGNFLSHTTAVVGALFFLNSLGLAYLSDHASRSVSSGIALPAASAPASSAAATAAPNVSKNTAAGAPAAPAVSSSAAVPSASTQSAPKP